MGVHQEKHKTFRQLFSACLKSTGERGTKEQGRNFGEIHLVFAEKWVDEGMMQQGGEGENLQCNTV